MDKEGNAGERVSGSPGPAQIAAIIAVGAAAASLVAGLGTYLYIRFTQHRTKDTGDAPSPGGQPRPSPADR